MTLPLTLLPPDQAGMLAFYCLCAAVWFAVLSGPWPPPQDRIPGDW